MDTQTLGIITLLSNALTENGRALPADFDWEALSSDLPQYKNLRGLLIRGATLAGVPRSHPVVKEMMIGFLEDIRRSRNQMQQLQAVYDAFDAQGVDYMPVKGAVLKKLYPQPEMRMMEDADILIRTEQIPIIGEIMRGMGMEERRGDKNEYVWNHPKLLLELHKSLVSSDFGEFSEYLKNSWDHAEKEPTGNAYRMHREKHFVFLVIHFAKHYMRGNISPKDICDFWVFRNAYPDLEEAYIEAEVQKLGLTEFYHNILEILNNWFCGGAATPAVQIMTKDIFQHGVADDETVRWGHAILSRQDTPGALGKSKFRFVMTRIFPPLATMQYRYPILLRKAWLTPVFWFVRWFELIFLQKRLDQAAHVLLKDDALQDYADHLHAVGLGRTLQK